MPEVASGTGGVSKYATLLDRMKAGDMVRLAEKHAYTFVSFARKHKVKMAIRSIGDGLRGVWRVE